uniref:Glycylpeptide N-tetradecanoyltransferase n=1 Tax=Nothobranchius furzeri TaxID=105023 RepID=A0A8C6MAY2_NOTFU
MTEAGIVCNRVISTGRQHIHPQRHLQAHKPQLDRALGTHKIRHGHSPCPAERKALPLTQRTETVRISLLPAIHKSSSYPSMWLSWLSGRYFMWLSMSIHVSLLGDSITTHGPIAEGETSVRKEPYSLPPGFCWDSLDLSNSLVLRELCGLLNKNYMEDDDNTIRFDFSLEYLQWALQSPNGLLQWLLAVRVDSNKKLVGFIAAVPAGIRIYETMKQLVQVKFLCVHKKLRLKRMAPVLIRELTRRVNQQGLHQAVYTAGTVLPTPLSSCSLWHRPLNPRKLMEVNFPGLRQKMSLQQAIKFYCLPEVPKVQGLRPMIKEDAPGIHSLLQKNLSKFHLSPLLSLQEVEHWFLPRENVNDTYVVEGDDGTLTDVVSFYGVSQRVLNHPVHTGLRAAYLLCITSAATELAELMKDTLILAKSKGFDVLCALDVMDNTSFLEKLKFTISDKRVHYYLYNWTCPLMSPDKVLDRVISPPARTQYSLSVHSEVFCNLVI